MKGGQINRLQATIGLGEGLPGRAEQAMLQLEKDGLHNGMEAQFRVKYYSGLLS